MAADIVTATDEILGAFKAAWDAGAGAFNGGTPPEVRYDGVGDPGPPDGEDAWARVTVRHFEGDQATLAGSGGVRRYRRTGIITVQVFYPLSRGGLSNARALARVAASAYEGVETKSHVWFRRVRTPEIGADRSWYNVNMTAEFEYDEFG